MNTHLTPLHMLNTRGRIRELAVVAVFFRILLPKPPVAVTKRGV